VTAVFSQAKIRQDKREFTKGVLAQFDHNHSGVTVSSALCIFEISWSLFVTDSQTNALTLSTGGLEYDQLREFLAHLGKEDPNTKFIRTHEPTDAEVIKCLIGLCVFFVQQLCLY